MSLFQRKLPVGMFCVFIWILPLLLLVISLWKFPFAMPVVSIGLLLLSLAITIFPILKKHIIAHRKGGLTRPALVLNTCLDIFGILITMVFAVLLTRYVVGIITKPISNDLVRLTAGIIIGSLVGLGMGIFMNRLRGHFVKASFETGA